MVRAENRTKSELIYICKMKSKENKMDAHFKANARITKVWVQFK